MFFKTWQNSQESNCVGVSFWKKQSGASWLKRDSDTEIFLWVLQNFQEHLLWRTLKNGCLLICFMKINNLPQRDKKRLNLKYLSPLVLSYQQMLLFPNNFTFPRNLYWPSKFQFLRYKFSLNTRSEALNKPTCNL